MPSAMLIANPSASQFTGGAFRDISRILSSRFDLDTSWPTSPRETTQMSVAAASTGVDVVFAMGGDGVAHHVANGVARSGSALGLIPAGTTNVLSRILGIPQKPAAAAEAALEYLPRPTRTVQVRVETPLGVVNRIATFSVGAGFDADVVEVAETRPFSKTRFGSVHYARTAISRLVTNWRSEPPHLRIVCDGDTFDAVVALTQVHDQYTYFGPRGLALTSEPVDGAATLAATSLGITKAVEIFTRAMAGRRQRPGSGVRVWSGYDTLTIDAEPRTPVQADGEVLGYADRVEITPVEGALSVLRPAEG